jgi:Na+/H+-dicarboxylate symporter
MIVIPLIFASVVRGLSASESVEQLQRMGLGVVVYFVGTTVVAIVIGLAVASLIKPGNYVDSASLKSLMPTGSTVEATALPGSPPSLSELPDKLVTIFPSNPLTSMVEGQMLQVVMFAMIMGIALVMMKPAQSKPLLDLMASLQEVCMTVVSWAMHLAPLAVFGLMAQLTSKIGLDAIFGMGVYVGTVLTGLLIMLLLYLLLIYLFSHQTPANFLRNTRDVLLLAFSTSSSAAVMPLSIRTAEEKLQVHPSVSQFVIPLGATINMNGTALYQGVATVFLAQVFAVDLSSGALLLVIVTAVGASIGSPGTPGVGIVILAMVLETVGIPVAGIVLIMGVDRILDMSRTAVNVCGDLVAARLMNRWMVKTELLQATHETNRLSSE